MNESKPKTVRELVSVIVILLMLFVLLLGAVTYHTVKERERDTVRVTCNAAEKACLILNVVPAP